MLSGTELLAILLGSGTKGHDIMTVAERILKVLDAHNEKLNLDELKKIEGVGPAKAALIAAALEFACRRIRPEGFKISFPTDMLPLIANYGDLRQEHFLCISINGANEVIARGWLLSDWSINLRYIQGRYLPAPITADRAAGIIVAHNHPSGSLSPSKADIEVARQLKAAGETLGIKLLDHIIF